MDNKPNATPEGLAPEGEESAQIDKISQLTTRLLDARYCAHKQPILRGVHPKSHGCVNAVFKINDDIAPSHQVGLFATPGKQYQAVIRFSNASVRVAHDLDNGENGSRGMALKVFAVGGKGPFLEYDQGGRNQDFLMINTAAFAFTNVPDYLRLNQVLLENNDQGAAFFAPLNPQVPGFSDEERARAKQTLDIVTEIKSMPVANPLDVQYFGAAPFRFGADRVMRFSVMPSAGAKEQIIPEPAAVNYLKDALVARMKQPQAVSFDFMVQVRDNDENNLQLEDATKRWDESEFEFIKVATITIPAPQPDIDSVQYEEACEKLVYNPWHSLVDHQPLGGINRLRKKVYSTSVDARLSAENTFKISLYLGGCHIGWFGRDSSDWAILVADKSKAVTLEHYPYDNVDYYRIKDTSRYLSVSNNDYVGFYNWFGATGWGRNGPRLISDYNHQVLSLKSKDNGYLYAKDEYAFLEAEFKRV
jgi:hypothetical protein